MENKHKNIGMHKMIVNYRAIVERCPFPNEVVGALIPVVKSSLYLMEEKT